MGRVLEVVERDRMPLTRPRLAMMKGIDLADLDMVKISQVLWAFLGGHALHNKVYERRLQLTGGEDGNGLELWRALYHENQGGAEHVIMGGGPPKVSSVSEMPPQIQASELAGRMAELEKDSWGHHG